MIKELIKLLTLKVEIKGMLEERLPKESKYIENVLGYTKL